MIEDIPGRHRVSLGAAKGYGSRDFVEKFRLLNTTPHVAQKERSAIDGRTTRHDGYRISQKVRKRVEKIFGWMKRSALSVKANTEEKRKLTGSSRQRLIISPE